jgi:DNA-binding protein H-NS
LAKYDLQSLSYKELRDLHARIGDEIQTRKQAEKSNVQKKVMELVQSAGFDIDDIVGKTSSKSLKGRKIAPKYRNPKNPDETWTGRGRQPKWLAQELSRGRSLKSFLIK